jgi:hypothetical protein
VKAKKQRTQPNAEKEAKGKEKKSKMRQKIAKIGCKLM